jgi:hypothetical protein
MGTNPGQNKMPNRNLGREMGRDDDNEGSNDVNVQEIATDPHTGNAELGTNFSSRKKPDQE